jgi:signal transduction histidine kinase
MTANLATARELAGHLRVNRETVFQTWISMTRTDSQTPEEEQLSDGNLEDHLPVIYDEVCDAIEHGGESFNDAARLARTGRLHGYYRWAQGYKLEELVRELDLFRRAVIQEAQAFCAGNRCMEGTLKESTLAIEDMLSEVTQNSLRQLMHQSRARIEATLEERRQAERALQDADARKDEFLAMLAHELRNPLAPIRTAVQILLAVKTELPDEAARAAGVIDRQSFQLQRLVNDLLDVARLTSGRITLKRVDAELRGVIREAVEQVRPLMTSRAHLLEVVLGDLPVYVDGDPERLIQVFSNLLTNAAKYTDRGGRVQLKLEPSLKEVKVTVTDTGRGIPADVLPHVFDLFTQSQRDLDRAEGGLGIGLTLVKTVVEMHGGKVLAESAGENKGSVLTVTLDTIDPIEPAPLDRDQADGSTPVLKQRILIVDDNEDASATLASLLEMLGFRVRSTDDGANAVELARSFNPDAILLDIGLPGMNGYEVCKALRALPGFASKTIIALTGYGQSDDRRRTREVGFDFHLVKPVEVGEIRKVIELGSRLKR